MSSLCTLYSFHLVVMALDCYMRGNFLYHSVDQFNRHPPSDNTNVIH